MSLLNFLDDPRRADGVVLVRADDRTIHLSRAFLRRRVAEVAADLRRRGLGPEKLAAVDFPPSEDWVIAILAILNVGAAWTAIDPAWPEERRRTVLKNAAPHLVLKKLPADSSPLLKKTPEPPAEAAAYVFHTSGSTGAPKGVVVSRRSLRIYLGEMLRLHQPRPDDVAIQLASPGFDVSVREIFLPLLAGSRLVLTPREVAADPAASAEHLHRERASFVLGMIPSFLDLFLQAADGLRLRRLGLAGEALPHRLVEEARRKLGEDLQIVNQYGPTECTGTSCAYEALSQRESGIVPLGRAHAHARVRIFDRRLRSAPPGETGEICISGDGLARGYLGNPGSTAASFVPDPDGDGERLYRTGDLGRRREDDVIEFVGRRDQQIKVRGVRIEPAEIESALREHPSVEEAAVAPASTGLLAAIVSSSSTPASTLISTLREHLSRRLPPQMIPARFTLCDRLPRTVTGKLDRRAIARLTPTDEALSAATPRSAIEQALVELWTEALGHADFGLNDDFFALGGHSLAAAGIVAGLRRGFDVEIALPRLLEEGTISRQALMILRATQGAGAATAEPDQPTTPAQRGLWLLEQSRGDAPAPRVSTALRLCGRLDLRRLFGAVEQIVERHEALRTVFSGGGDDETPVPVVRNDGPRPLVVDLQNFKDESRFLRDFVAAPLPDPRRRPPWRFVAARFDETTLLVFVFHHLIFDGWSRDLLLDELRRLLAGEMLDPLPALPRFPKTEDAEAFEDLDLPIDHPPQKERPNSHGTSFDVRFHGDTLRRKAAQARVSFAVAACASTSILLGRLCNQDAPAIAVALAGRDHPATHDRIGSFADLGLLRVDLSEDPTIAQAFELTRDALFKLWIESSTQPKTLRRAPRASCAVHQLPRRSLDIPGVSTEWAETPHFSRLDLEFHWREDRLRLGARADLWDRTTLHRFAEQAVRLLREAQATDRLSDLPLLSRAQQHQLLTEWNDREDAALVEDSLIEPFLLRTQATPDAVAVSQANEFLTYAELERRSRAAARNLQNEDVGPGSRIGLSTQRRLETVVRWLAIVRAGGAWVPIDPETPPEKRKALENALVVSAEYPKRPSSPEDAAYVLFTSGSTGAPKGVVVSRRAAAHHMAWMQRDLPLEADDHVLLKTPLGFDASIWEFWTPLWAGAHLKLASSDAHRDPERLLQEIERDRITVLQVVPTLLRQLTSLTGSRTLRRLASGGEALSRNLFEAARGAFPQAEIVNLYGPTETTIQVAFESVRDVRGGFAPIGRPIANAALHVFDHRLQPALLGAAGELYVGGPSLARALLDRPAETARRFIPDPRPRDPGSRLYATGDMVRRLADGRLEFLRRRDSQIKIAGVRIEIGEIEAALESLPEVRSAAVVVVEGSPIAHLIADSEGREISLRETHRRTASRLPAIARPVRIHWRDELPRTSSGKLDRRALVEIDSAPTTVMQSGGVLGALTEIWRDILALDVEPNQTPNTDASFFALGGDSLAAVRLSARIRRVFDREISLADFFAGPTLSELTRRISSAPIVKPTRSVSRDRAAPITPLQKKLYLAQQLDPASTVHHMPSRWRLRGPLDARRLQRAFIRLVERHEALRTRFVAYGETAKQRIDPSIPAIPLPLIDLSGADDQADVTIAALLRRSFALDSPPWRAALLRFSPSEHEFVFVVHHLVFDGASRRIFARDLARFFRGESLPVLPFGPVDFAAETTRGDISSGTLPRGSLQRGPAGRMDRPLPKLQAAALHALLHATGTTRFMIYGAVFAVLLARLFDRRDVLLSTAIDHRPVEETEDLIGLFVKTAVLGVELADCRNFSQATENLRRASLKIWNFDLETESDVRLSPIFYGERDRRLIDLDLGDDLETVAIEPSDGEEEFELSLEAGAEGKRWTWRRDLYDEIEILRFDLVFDRLTQALVASPEAPLRICVETALLSRAERHQLLHEIGTGSPPAPQTTVVDEFFARARERPDAIAIEGTNESLTYGEAARRIRMRTQGASDGPKTLIAGEPIPETVIRVFAALARGDAYVGYDPALPSARLQELEEDCAPRPQDREPAEDRDEVERLAYLLYTSGSTGRPKGVLIDHRALANHTFDAAAEYDVRASDRVLQFASLAFDTSAEEIYPTLTRGATLVLREPLDGAAQFLLFLARRRLSVVHLPTTFWNLLADEVGSGRTPPPDALRTASIGGEKMHREPLDAWLRAMPHVRTFNGYGPTETTVVVLRARLRDAARPPTVGRPIRGVRARVTNRSLHLQPQGVVGELVIGGVQTARGYHRRPARTATSFVPDPWREDGARLYRTGDLARWDRRGGLTIEGRRDHQVKIRGVRVELGEVENALRALPEVRDAAALTVEDDGRPVLAAFVEPRRLDAKKLRAALRERLPAASVPSRIEPLARLPKTTGGKHDRSLLRERLMRERMRRRRGGATSKRGFQNSNEARSKEEILCEIWAETLGVAEVGPHENFFELGGDSIVALRVAAAARRAGWEVRARDLFRRPTPAEAAELARPLAPETIFDETSTDEPMLTPIQRWFLERGLPEPEHENWTTLRRVPEEIAPDELLRAFDRLLKRHDLPFATARIDLRLKSPDSETSRLERACARLQRSLRFDEVLFRAVVLETSDGMRMLWIAHHLVIDQVSWSVLFEDLEALLWDRSLTAASATCARYAAQLAARAPLARAELPFWQEQLRDVVPLPRDRDGVNSRDSRERFQIDAALDVDRLRRDAADVDLRLDELFLTALVRAAQTWTGRTHLVVELERHGREDVGLDVSRSVGWFTALHPLRLEIGGDDPALHLAKTREALRAVPQGGIGFGQLREILREPTLRPSASPTPEIAFNFLGRIDPPGRDVFPAAPESPGPPRSRRGERALPLEIDGGALADRLRWTFIYSRNLYDRDTIGRLARRFVDEIHALIDGFDALREIERIRPLTPMQEGMLLHGDAYFDETKRRLPPDVDVAALRRAWRHCERRHGVLRSAVVRDAGSQPMQVFYRTPNLASRELHRVEIESGRMLWRSHHLLLDGWSTQRVLDEVETLYAEANPIEADLPKARIAPRRARLESEQAQKFWRRTLRGFDAPTPLPIRAAEEIVIRRILDERASRMLLAACRRLRITLAVLMQGAWAILLARGREEAVFGLTSSGREDLEHGEEIVDLLIETVPLRVRLPRRALASERLSQLQELSAAARAQGFLGLPAISAQSEIEAPRQLFESLLVVENLPPRLSTTESRLFLDAPGSGRSHYPLELCVLPGREIELRLSGAVDEALADRLTTLLKLLSEDGNRIGDVERAAYGRTEPLPAPRGTLADLFARQAQDRPDAVAVVFGSRQLSYGELARRAQRRAEALRAEGVGPESRVELTVRPGPEMLVELLAILWAGGAYVPLDPAHPADRLDFIRRDALETLSQQNRGVPETCADHLAYVIYTSGSTGRPKGVGVTHANVLSLLSAVPERFSDDDVWTLYHSVSFDFSVWEIWGAFAAGGRLVIVPPLVARDPGSFADLLTNERVSVLNQTPSAFRLLTHSGALPPRRLRTIIFGGEALDREHLQPWIDRGPKMINMYGITETTVHVTYRPVRPDDEQIFLGRPLTDWSLHLLDAKGREVEAGEKGELCVGGAGVTRGYLGRPALTAQRFVPDPFGPPGARLYRSGDLARRRDDGEIEYFGRIDHQVQIRGYRVELGEIESAMRRHPAVRDALALARGESLHAWYVGDGVDEVGEGASLREVLRRRLPNYMLPLTIRRVDRFPMTVNGKIDRDALFSGEEISRPRTAAGDLERLLAEIWCEVLERDSIEEDDDFFALGGHSLTVLRLTARIQTLLGVEISPRTIFETPRLADLADRPELRDAREQPRSPRSVAARSESSVSFGQERLWFLQKLEPESVAYLLLETWDLRGSLDERALARAWNGVVELHEVLRTRYPQSEGRPRLLVEPARRHSLPRLDLSGLRNPEDEARRLMLLESRRPFDLENELPWRVFLMRLGAGRRFFCRTLHHIASDGWSETILRGDLAALYAGKTPAPPTTTYAAEAIRTRRLFVEEGSKSLEFWRERLQGVADLDLPTDYPRPEWLSEHGGWTKLRCSDEASARVKELARSVGATPFMIFLTAWKWLLGRLSGADDFAVGTPIAGRRSVESETVVGFFVNMLVLRVPLAEARDVAEAVRCVRDACLDSWPHQGVPFERLVEEVSQRRDPSRPPIFQTTLTFQNAPDASVRLGDLDAKEVFLGTGAVHFDLEMILWEEGGGFVGNLGFRRDLFKPETGRRLVDAFVSVLEQFHQHLRLEEISIDGAPATPSSSTRQEPAQSLALPLKTPPREISRVPWTASEHALAEIWQTLLGCRIVEANDDFFELGGHSLLAVHLLARIEARFGIRLHLRDLFRDASLEALARRLDLGDDSQREGPLVALRPISDQATRRPLFCVHPVGGHVFCYRELVQCLDPSLPFYALEAEDDVPPHLSATARNYLSAVRAVQPQGPYRFGGWSMGGVVAWEMTRLAEAEGEQVDLILIDAPVPGAAEPIDEEEVRRLYDLDAESTWRVYLRNHNLLSRFSPVGERPQARTLLLHAVEGVDPAAWRAWIAGEFEIAAFAGDHFSLLRTPMVAALARRLQEFLESSS